MVAPAVELAAALDVVPVVPVVGIHVPAAVLDVGLLGPAAVLAAFGNAAVEPSNANLDESVIAEKEYCLESSKQYLASLVEIAVVSECLWT